MKIRIESEPSDESLQFSLVEFQCPCSSKEDAAGACLQLIYATTWSKNGIVRAIIDEIDSYGGEDMYDVFLGMDLEALQSIRNQLELAIQRAEHFASDKTDQQEQ